MGGSALPRSCSQCQTSYYPPLSLSLRVRLDIIFNNRVSRESRILCQISGGLGVLSLIHLNPSPCQIDTKVACLVALPPEPLPLLPLPSPTPSTTHNRTTPLPLKYPSSDASANGPPSASSSTPLPLYLLCQTSLLPYATLFLLFQIASPLATCLSLAASYLSLNAYLPFSRISRTI